ncbi:MAG: Hsp20/alpha crystallin family protein [Rhodothermales bacterium]
MRYHRGSDFDVLRREMSRLFDDFLPTRSTGGEQQESAVWAPRADISETDDAFVLALDLPGIGRDDLDITVEDGTLKISGERSMREEHESGQFHRVERSYGRFFRSFNFGPNVDPDNIDATFDDGVLTLRVGKAEERKPRRIEVGSRQELEATS